MATPQTHSSTTKTNGNTSTGSTPGASDKPKKERKPMTVRLAVSKIMRMLDALPSDADRQRVLASVSPLYASAPSAPTPTTPAAQ